MVCVWPLIKTWDVRIEKMGYEMLRGQTNSEHLHPTHACRISNFESPPFFPHFLPYSLWTLFFAKYTDMYTQHHQYFIDQMLTTPDLHQKADESLFFLANLESRSVEKISIIRLMVCNCQLKYSSITANNKKWIIWLPEKFSFLKWCL